MLSKHALMAASSTHSRPWLTAWRIVPRASCAERFGPNPKLTGEKSASKTGSNTIFAAAITTLSRTVGMPSEPSAESVVGAPRGRAFGQQFLTALEAGELTSAGARGEPPPKRASCISSLCVIVVLCTRSPLSAGEDQ